MLPVVKKRKILAIVHKDAQKLRDEAGPCDNLSNVQEGTLGKAQRVDAEP